MSEIPAPPLATVKRRNKWLPRLRFSLRTLIISVLLTGGAVTLWLHWEPWQRLSVLTHDYEQISFAAFSSDYSKAIWIDTNGSIRVNDARSGEEKSVVGSHYGDLEAFGILDGRPIEATVGCTTETKHLPNPVDTFVNNERWRDDFRARHAQPLTFEFNTTLDDALQLFLNMMLKEKFVYSQALLDLDKPKSDLLLRVKSMDPLTALDWILKIADVRAEWVDGVFHLVTNEEFEKHRREKIESTVCIWDLEMLKPIVALSGQSSKIIALTLSPNAKYVFAASEDGSARLWELPEGKTLARFQTGDDTVVKAAVSNNGKRVALEFIGVKFGVLNSDDGSLRILAADVKPADFITASPDGSQACFVNQKSADLWNLNTATLQSSILATDGDFDFTSPSNPPIFNPAAGRLLIQFNNSVHLLNSHTGEQLAVYDRTIRAGQFSADGMRLAGIGGAPKIVAAETGEIIAELPWKNRSLDDAWQFVWKLFSEEPAIVGAFAPSPPRSPLPQFSADGKLLLVLNADSDLGVWSRRRPEYWWGVAWLPEFWLTIGFAAALVWSIWTESRSRLN